MKRLITLGDSWMFGVGCHYVQGMSKEDYFRHTHSPWDDNGKPFRQLIAENHNIENVNMSEGGSSNQRQFRLAEQYFLDDNKGRDSDVVLWGLTSVYRIEYFDINSGQYINTHVPGDNAVSKVLAGQCWDEKEQTKDLSRKIQMWNVYFSAKGIRNFWIDLFSDHKFDKHIPNLLFQGKSLLSVLTGDMDENDRPHRSDWLDTDRKIKSAVEKGIANPFTGHPTKQAHQIIARMIMEQI